MSGVAAAIVVAAGLVTCVVAVVALRMVVAAWAGRVHMASQRRAGHVVWRGFDRFAVTLWTVAYALGGLAVAAGLFTLLG